MHRQREAVPRDCLDARQRLSVFFIEIKYASQFQLCTDTVRQNREAFSRGVSCTICTYFNNFVNSINVPNNVGLQLIKDPFLEWNL